MKDLLELLEQFEEFGYVTHECPECGMETNPIEPDSDQAFCEVCNKLVEVERLI